MIHKQRSYGDDVVLVTFELPTIVGGERVHLVGDMNAWNQNDMPMHRNGNDTWQITLPLQTGRDFQFRYLVDGQRWYNDWAADSYAPNPYGGKNSVVTTRPDRLA
jgi:1,4-alpha-glucan branching enzyme